MVPSPPAPFKKSGSDTLQPVSSGITKVRVGSANTTEGTEVIVLLHEVENDASETITSFKKTIEYIDETDATEDAIVREYSLVGGALGLLNSSKLYTAEPTGDEAPIFGCRVLADRVTWDPLSKGSGGAYWVWYDGSSWIAIDGQAS